MLSNMANIQNRTRDKASQTKKKVREFMTTKQTQQELLK